MNTLICHRLNDHDVTEQISNWVGTQDRIKLTAQVAPIGEPSIGSARAAKEFFIHPDTIKQSLDTGEVFFVTKVGGFRIDRVKVKYS